MIEADIAVLKAVMYQTRAFLKHANPIQIVM
jgi:hypothetical protein